MDLLPSRLWPRRSRLIMLLAVTVIAVASVPISTPIQPTTTSVVYQHPVQAPVIDPFRMDNGPFGPGNRGLEYATSQGDDVFAAADGVVLVARVVVGRGVVTLLHLDGLRTAVTGLEYIAVQEGHHVQRGQPIGRASGPIHFSLRDGDAYLDPALFIVSSADRKRSRAVLVPTPPNWY